MNQEVPEDPWRQVILDGREYPYEVSRQGNVRRTGRKKCLSPGVRAGYLRVSLSQDGETRWMEVHRLVAHAFLGTPSDPSMVVHHQNDNRTDNRVENLAWVTPSENRVLGAQNQARLGGSWYTPGGSPPASQWRRVTIDRDEWPYEVSDFGEVRRVGRSGVLRQGGGRGSYPYVGLSRNGVVKTVKIHRLVADAFLPGRSKTKAVVNHKNGARDDNRAANLEWVSIKENARHARRTGLRPPDAGRVVAEEEVEAIRQLYEDGCHQEVVAARFGISQSLVSLIVRGERHRDVGGPVSTDNARRSGSRAKGSANPASVLSDDSVREIRRRWSAGESTQVELAEEFGVRQGTVSKVIRRATWAHVD